LTSEIVEMLGGRPGWRREPRSTPGSTPLWAFVYNGKIEYSVTADAGTIRLYVMETDQEISFDSADGLMSWLRSNRPEAAQESEAGKPRKSIFRRVTEWE
jgi:hypothetical protein